MKIVHICLGGGWYEKNAYQDQLLPRYQQKLGHSVTVIASYYGRWNLDKNSYDLDRTRERLLEDGVKLIRVRPLLPCSINAHIHMFERVGKIVEKENPNLIFIHDVESPNNLFAIRYKKRHPSVKIVCDNHSDYKNSQHHWASSLWAKFVVRNQVVRKIIPYVEWFYGTTPARCDYLEEVYGVPHTKVRLLVMGADDDSMRLEHRESISISIRQHNEIAESDFLIVTGGRISAAKSEYFFKLAKAVCSIPDSHLKLLIFGPISDDIKPLFDQFSPKRVLCVGQVPSDRVYDYFYAADFVMFTGLHSVLWEQAIASKVPCAFTKINGFEHVNINDNCILMEGHDENYYRQLILSVYQDADFYRRLKVASNSSISESFLYSRIAQQVIDDCFQK